MNLAQHPVLDRLVLDEPCLGAAFTTYTFDPSFFEQHVLAAVLRIGADPDEAAAAYHDEALAKLQEVPVAGFVDGDMRPPGHQLPYDLREVRGRCFHPKVVLLLYEQFARVSVGSGNLTKAGYGGNAETFFVHDLRYEDPDDAAVLRQVEQFFRALDHDALPPGGQTAAVLDALARRIQRTPAPTKSPQLLFLHTEGERSLLTQIFEALPPRSKITRIGLLAPFFERDDFGAAEADDLSSVLVELAARAGKEASLDLGVSWEDAAMAPIAAERRAIRDGLEALWAQIRDGEDGPNLEYFVPIQETANNYRCVDQRGKSRLLPKEAIDEAVEEGNAWLVGRPRAFAPPNLVATARASVKELRTWLFPTPRLIDGRKLDRPLHAKLLSIVFQAGSKRRTLVVVGSANASRRALLSTPDDGGNIEACVAFVVDDDLALPDLAPELVHCACPVDWQERTFPELPPPPSIPFIDAAVFDPRAEVLIVTWSSSSRSAPQRIGAWTLRYQSDELAHGSGMPPERTLVSPFRLSPASCEITVAAPDGERSFPIVVNDLAALPVGSSASSLSLRDLLALVGRRLSPGRHKAILEKHGRTMVDATLDTIFGEGFAPTDVLRAWWALAEDLQRDGLTVAGFRLRLLGTLSAAAVWARLRDLARTPDSGVRLEEAWFYGVELRRALIFVEPPGGADRVAKLDVLEQFLDQLSADLRALEPPVGDRHWIARIVTFYAESRS